MVYRDPNGQLWMKINTASTDTVLRRIVGSHFQFHHGPFDF